MDKADEGFEDDLPYAKKVADDLNVDLHIIPADHNIVDQFDHMIWHLDEPQADPAPINVYNISKGARELGIKVLLGGTAGDDLFSGYRRHQALKYDQYLDIVPTQFRKLLKKGINLLPSNKPLSRRLQKLSRDWDKPLDKRMLGYFNWLPDEEYVFSLFQNEILKGDDSYSVYSYFNKILNQQSSNLSPLDRLLYLEIKTFLVDHNLNYTDKMSMAAGVEARVPYLDKELVEFAGKVPMNYKLRNGETKYILKKVAERYLPKGVIYRSKTGFGAPIRDWLRNDLKPMVNERLDRDFLSKQGIFDPDAIQEMIKKNDSGKFDFSYTIWSMLAIQSWLKQFKWSL
jgi:asparagine synthase (glutamine-hydrolysing)